MQHIIRDPCAVRAIDTDGPLMMVKFPGLGVTLSVTASTFHREERWSKNYEPSWCARLESNQRPSA